MKKAIKKLKKTSHSIDINPNTGQVVAEITFDRGPRYFVKSVKFEEGQAPYTSPTIAADQPYTHRWLANYKSQILNQFYKQGYPETSITFKLEDKVPNSNGSVSVDIVGTITPGELVHIKSVEYVGTGKTKKSIIEGRNPPQAGTVLNILETQDQVNYLTKLDIFSNVNLNYNKDSPSEWDVLYEAQLKRKITVNLLAGYGSYDLFMAGFEVDHTNILSRAHNGQLRAVQSFKTTDVSYTYNIPQILGRDISGYLNTDWLNRKEISFIRQEFSASAGLSKFIKKYKINTNLEYDFEQDKAQKQSFNPRDGLDQAYVSSIQLSLTKNHLNNPLFPERGYRLFSTIEVAVPYLGGKVEYERVELGGAYHHPLFTKGTVVHFGLKHGFVYSFDGIPENLPINKRFFYWRCE